MELLLKRTMRRFSISIWPITSVAPALRPLCTICPGRSLNIDADAWIADCMSRLLLPVLFFADELTVPLHRLELLGLGPLCRKSLRQTPFVFQQRPRFRRALAW